MRAYVVQPGDSPAKIAIAHAGCPKCAIDLVSANPHKSSITHPNGFRTFRDLRAGERIWLPDKWFNGDLDRMPQSYFDALPYADGVTPGRLGQAPTQAMIDMIGFGQEVGKAIAADPNYCASVAQAGSAVNTAVHQFKTAWNANSPNNPVPIGTGTYEQATATALATVLGDATPAACPPRPSTSTAPTVSPVLMPISKGLSTGAIVGIGLGAAVLVGGVTYAATRKPKRRGRR